MSDKTNPQSNNTQPTPDMNPMSSLNGQGFDVDKLGKVIARDIANALNGNYSSSSGSVGKQYSRTSQSNYADKQAKWKFEDTAKKAQEERRKKQGDYKHTGSILGDFEEGIKDQLLDTLAGGDFKKGLQGALDTFEKEFGVQFKDLSHEMGKQLGKQFADSELGKNLKEQAMSKLGDLGSKAMDKMFGNAINGSDKAASANAQAAKDALSNVAKSFFKSGGSAEGVATDVATNVASSAASNVAADAGSTALAAVATEGAGAAGAAEAGAAASTVVAGDAMAGLAAGAGELLALLFPEGLIIIGAVLIATKLLGPAFEGLKKVTEAAGKAMKREQESRKKRLEEEQKRLKADLDGLVQIPFDILKEAANKWASTWDANLEKVSMTQGYDKENVYGLYSSFAERLTDEGLNTIISATDIIDKLGSVLDSGLSGKVAEEFAYMASKLNAAIPTEDFFGYASAYSSLASSAIANGASQAEAIAYANSQLEAFASNLLYSSRELAGGFSTGLKNASDLFNQSVEIARTARISDTSALSGTLTSVSAIIGAVAPDLANGLVSNIVNAAIGGNNDTFVALRSLAGINAGNTEFLRQMVEDPQAIFTKIFTSLADMQNMSPDNYMEVAEGLASIFGVDMKAFAQVDFNYLASAISQMNANNGSLDDNLSLLTSGASKTLAEQQKMEEINRAILDEGLAYVIDNEAARMIQEHMWDEQLALQLQENTYAVELQGAALEFLEGIRQTVTNVLNFLNPIGFLTKSIANLTETVAESIGNDQDLKEILQLGAVGANQNALYNLTHRGDDLGLTKPLVEMMGGTKGIAALNAVSAYTTALSLATSSADRFNTLVWDGQTNIMKAVAGLGGSSSSSASSKYAWNTVGKSTATALRNTSMSNTTLGSVEMVSGNQAEANAQAATAQSNELFKKFLDTAKEASKEQTYEEWVATAKNFGIADYQEALKNFGRSESDISNFFEQNAAKAGAEKVEENRKDEELFRTQMREFWGLESGDGGLFNANLWNPFYGDNQKYDTRMDAVDLALSNIQGQLGDPNNHTVISGIEALITNIGGTGEHTIATRLTEITTAINNFKTYFSTHFVSSSSNFQKYLAAWAIERANVASYKGDLSKSSAWSDLEKAEEDDKKQTTLALANALQEFSANDLQKLDPQLQANALLGKIVILLEAIMQQNNNNSGFNLVDTLQALGLGGSTTTTT